MHCIRTIIGGDEVAVDEHKPPAAADRLFKLPARPGTHILSESIPPLLAFGLRQRGRTGDVFLFKNSALRFAKKNSGRSGCATMFLAERLELDVENQGNRLIAWIGTLLNLLTRYVPKTIRHRSHCSRDSANQNGCGQQSVALGRQNSELANGPPKNRTGSRRLAAGCIRGPGNVSTKFKLATQRAHKAKQFWLATFATYLLAVALWRRARSRPLRPGFPA